MKLAFLCVAFFHLNEIHSQIDCYVLFYLLCYIINFFLSCGLIQI